MARGQGIHVSAFGNGTIAVLAAVVIAAGLFGMTGAGLGAALHNQLTAVTAMLLYLYVLEPLVSHIASLRSARPATCPASPPTGSPRRPRAAASRLLPPWAGGLVFAARAAAFAITGAIVTARTDIT